MKYASIDVKKSAKMPPVPIKIHFTQQLISRDLRRFRPSHLIRMFTGLLRFVSWGENRKTNFQCRDEIDVSPGFRNKTATKSVLSNATLDENYCFFIFFLFEPIGIRFHSHLPKFGVHRLRLRNYNGRWVMPVVHSCFTRNQP